MYRLTLYVVSFAGDHFDLELYCSATLAMLPYFLRGVLRAVREDIVSTAHAGACLGMTAGIQKKGLVRVA